MILVGVERWWGNSKAFREVLEMSKMYFGGQKLIQEKGIGRVVSVGVELRWGKCEAFREQVQRCLFWGRN